LLASCYRNCFALARERGIKSLAFPAISCGVYRFPLEQAVEIALRETRAALEKSPAVEQVVFACFGDEVFEAYRRAVVRG
jgi:O-acetyl-ADP-ribose deacetylase (regulator of RNase III)